MKKKFIDVLADIAEEVYLHLGGGNFDEKDFQKALGIEFRDRKIDYLRELHVELFYKNVPLKLGAPDFFFNKLRSPAILEVKLGSIADGSRSLLASRQQLRMYLDSIKKSTNPALSKVREGYLLNFLKIEPEMHIDQKMDPPKKMHKIDIEHYNWNKKKHLQCINTKKVGPI